MRVMGKTAGIAFLLVMAGGIVLSIATDSWSTESNKVPARFSSGEFAGVANPSDIRGSYTFGDIVNSFPLPLEDLARGFAVPSEGSTEYKVKSIEERWGIIDGREVGTDSVRLFIALYLGLPYEAESDTALPKPAVSLLRKLGTLSESALNLADKRTVSLDNGSLAGEASTHQETDEIVIKGKTLYADLLNWGLTEDQIVQALGFPMGARGTSVRDHCSELGVEFSIVKEAIQEKLDALP